ncbi:MAG: DUF4358 domain-containing protein [Eubacterium sp.]|jgi:hypothetical protein|nr:DUF4358 domain-containing protein [Eubacterium sp.]
MKKYISCVLLTAMLVMSSACGSADTKQTQDAGISMPDLQEAMLAADTTLPDMTKTSSEDEQAELNFTSLTDISYDKIDAYFYAYATEGTAEEIAVIRLKDKNDAAAMMESLHEHITQRQGTFQEYAPEQAVLTEKAVVTRQGLYVALIISSKNGLVQKAFEKSFE